MAILPFTLSKQNGSLSCGCSIAGWMSCTRCRNDLLTRRHRSRRPPSYADPRLLRGHGFFRHRLSRQLFAFHGARGDQSPAADGRRAAHAVCGSRIGNPRVCVRGALDADRFFHAARLDAEVGVVPWQGVVKVASVTLVQEVRGGEVVLVKAEVRVAFISE